MTIKLGSKKIIIRRRFFVIAGIIGLLILAYFFLGERAKERYIAGLEKAQVEVLGNNKTSKSSQNPKQEAIEKLKENYKNKFVIIFFYDGYKDQNEALNYIAVMKGALDLIEPFKSLKEGIVYKTFTTDSDKCKVEVNSKQKFLTCDPKLIDSFRNLGIDRFKLVILSPLEFTSTALPARGSNSWMTISTSLENRTRDENKRLIGLQFAQNLGRALGLASEDNLATNSAQIAKSLVENPPNCAKDQTQAEAWWGGYPSIYNKEASLRSSASPAVLNVGYFKGCLNNPEFIYPEEGTLMSNSPKKESYGKVSEDYLRGILSCYYMDKETLRTSASPAVLRDSILFGAGETATYSATLNSCSLFKKDYPDFWSK